MQKKVHQLIENYDLSASPESRYIDLTSSIGDLGKALLQASDYGLRSITVNEAIEREVGSCLFSLYALCDDYGVDAASVLESTIEDYASKMRQLKQSMQE